MLLLLKLYFVCLCTGKISRNGWFTVFSTFLKRFMSKFSKHWKILIEIDLRLILNFNYRSLKRLSASAFMHVRSLLEPVFTRNTVFEFFFFFDKSAIKVPSPAEQLYRSRHRYTGKSYSLWWVSIHIKCQGYVRVFSWPAWVRSRFYSDFLIIFCLTKISLCVTGISVTWAEDSPCEFDWPG